MTPAQLEKAARHLCKLRKVDPDASVHAPRNDGLAVMTFAPRWRVFAKEIQAAFEIQEAIEHGLTREIERDADGKTMCCDSYDCICYTR